MSVKTPDQGFDRRRFMKTAGALGTAAAVPGLLAPQVAQAGLLGGRNRNRLSRERVERDLVPHLDTISLDTMAGVAAFVVPGNDPYSIAQGVSTAEPGGMATRTDIFLVAALNNFLPLPSILQWTFEQMMTDLSAIPTAIPTRLSRPLTRDERVAFATLGDGVDALLQANGTVPLAIVFASILNILSIGVNPASRNGQFLTPFARLTWEQKAQVWEQFESTLPDRLSPDSTRSILPIISVIRTLLATLGGLVDFSAGAILEFAAFGAYSEVSVFDPVSRRLLGRPVGWELSGYQPEGPVEGWDEFKGYFEGRREVSHA